MTQRTMAGLLAVPLLVALWVVALLTPLPYVTYSPGLTVDVLDAPEGEETIQVDGRKTYRTGGQLRMTTVYVTQPETDVNLFELMEGWLSRDDAVYPYQAVYPDGETNESNKLEGAIEMVSSQDSAIAVALSELDVDYTEAAKVFSVEEGTPADGALQKGDVLASVGGTPVTTTNDVATEVRSTAAREAVDIGVVRDGEVRTVSVTPESRDGRPTIGIQMVPSFRFPFDVEVGISEAIGGPSAGLMFSLGIYDTLTPGSLTGDATVAGTGSITPDGKVGPIGGIQQKIAAARDAGASLFLVPPDNCAEALDSPNEDMRLVRTETMHDAVEAIEAWVDDPDTSLPTCTAGNS
ncbi:MAG: YlbL family protein [Nocardioides sp.]